MSFSKLKSPKVEAKTNLGVQHQEEAEGKDSKPREINGQTISQLIENLLNQVNETETYNNVTGTVSSPDIGLEYKPEEIDALKKENREETKRIKSELLDLKAKYIEAVQRNNYVITYDANRNQQIHRFLSELFDRPVESPGEVTSSEFLELKEMERRLVKSESPDLVAGIDTRTTDYISYPELNSRDRIATRYGVDVLTESINLIEDSDFSRIDQGIPVGYGLLPIFDSIIDIEEQISGVENILARTDEDTSYVESLFNRNLDEPVNSELLGRPMNRTFKEIMEKCFDCFLGAWNGPVDFRFHLSIELNIKELLAQLDFLLGRIRFALDIEGMIKSNVCSLFNLGVLCPIELAFLIASLIGLLKYCALEIVLNFRGFLVGLIASILDPLLRALQLAASFGIAPLNIYAGCVFNTFLTAQQIQWTGQMTMAQIAAVDSLMKGEASLPFGRQNNPSRNRRQRSQNDNTLGNALNTPLSFNARLTANEVLGPVPQERIQETRQRLNNNPRLAAIVSRLRQLASTDQMTIDLEDTGADFLEMMNEKLVAGDATLTSSIAALEFVEKMNNHYKWINNALAALRNWAATNSASRIELAAKIAGISTLISVLVALYELMSNKNLDQLCSVQTNPDGTTSITPTASTDLLFDTINSNPVLILENPSNNPSNNPDNNEDEPVILNTVTGTRTPIVNCKKAAPIVLSDSEIAGLLSRI